MTEGRAARPSGGTDNEADASAPDHVDAINQLFAEFELAYHNQYRKAYPDGESLFMAKKYWLSCLSGFSPLQITRAARMVVKTRDYLPSVAAVVQACESGLELYGLPAPRQAYLEACRAPQPKSSFAWSHPAVYYAGRASDWFVLATEPESAAFPVFEHFYRIYARQVMRGEKLEVNPPKALVNNPGKKTDPEERRLHVEKLWKTLNS